MANLNIKTSLTGGAVDCVDRNTAGMKVSGSVCFALIDGSPNVLRAYKYDASSTATANGDTVIIPYGQSGGTAGRWLLKGKMRADDNIEGNSATVTNGVYTEGNQTVADIKTFSISPVVPDGDASGEPVHFGQFAANSALVKTSLNAGGEAPIYACRAWVSFNGSGTVGILGAGNVTSITDRGTGLYTANLTVALNNTNAAAIAGCRGDSSEADRCPTCYIASTSQVYVCTANSGASKQDVGYITLTIIT